MAAEKTWKVSLVGSWLSWAVLVSAFYMLVLAYTCYEVSTFWKSVAAFVRAELSGASGFFTARSEKWADTLLALSDVFMPYVAVLIATSALALYAATATSAAPPKCPFLRFSAASCAVSVPLVFAIAAIVRAIGVSSLFFFFLFAGSAVTMGAALFCVPDARIRRYCAAYHLRAQPPAVIA